MASESTGFKGFKAEVAINKGCLVKAGTDIDEVTLNGSEEVNFFGSASSTVEADEHVNVKLANVGGTHLLRAAGAISAGATVYAAANGEIDAAGTNKIGTALNAAGAQGDLVEVLLINHAPA